MHTRYGPKPISFAFSVLVLFPLLFFPDFWIAPAFARIYCDDHWTPQPKADEVVWLPYKTFCQRHQTMISNPHYFISDHYPDQDLPNCKELGTAWVLDYTKPYPGCAHVPIPGYLTYITIELPLACNGNSYPGGRPFIFNAHIENYKQFVSTICPGYPTQTYEWGVATKFFVREPIGPDEINAGKNRGKPSCGLAAGNPIHIATGNKFHAQQDVTLPDGLEISRYYNSSDPDAHGFGKGWRGSFSRTIEAFYGGDHSRASLTLINDDGAVNYWRIENGVLQAPPDAAGKLDIAYDDGFVIGFTLVTRDNSIETYDETGRLLSVTNNDGQTLSFSYTDSGLASVTAASGRSLSYVYDESGRISQISSSGGSTWSYVYDANDNLSRVEFPDGSVKTYHYEDENFPNALTGVTDENADRIRSWAYDDTGRAILSTHGDALSSVERHTISYNADGTTTTSSPLQLSVDHTFETRHGIAKFGTASETCSECGNSTKSTTYDKRGNRDLVTDFAGNTTDYDYTPDNLLQKVTHAVGTPQQYEIEYTWDANLRKPLTVINGTVTTEYTYNQRGQALVKRESETGNPIIRTSTYTYFEAPALPALVGKLISVDGPRTDVADITLFEYYDSDDSSGHYRAGDLKAVVNPLGHRTDYLKYDGDGRLLEVSDANGVISSFAYHPRGWRSSTIRAGNTTVFSYDNAGNLIASTQADGTRISYEYDSYQRLTAIEDDFGNRVEYTLDAAGNRIAERTLDDQGVLRGRLARTFNSLNLVETIIDGNDGETRFEYDDNGNRISILDPALNTTRFQYDPMERLVKIIDPVEGATGFTHDRNDNPVQITDPAGGITQYTYDGLGNQILLDSPDSGTATYEYDEAGNRTAVIDARGVRTEFTYDALNRLQEISYPDSTLDVTWSYDSGTFGKGRMTGMSDAAGYVEYTYDALGNLVQEARTVGADQFSTSYAYDSAGRVVQITYPSGMVIDLLLNASGQTTAIRKSDGSGTEMLVDDVLYAPFGPFTSFTYGNGTVYSAALNLDYEADQIQSGPGLNWVLSRDSVGNVAAITDLDNAQQNQDFTYDDLYRLVSAQGGYGPETFSYDANGNRSRFVSDTTDESYTYLPLSNQLLAQGNWDFGRDAAGHRIEKLNSEDVGQLYDYGDHNRLTQVSIRDGSGDFVVGSYEHSGSGQRFSKSVDDEKIRYVYGPSGELLGEYSVDSGGSSTEYVYLNSHPVAAITHDVAVIRPIGKEVILDNGDPGTSSTGGWRTSKGSGTYGNDYLLASKASGRSYRWTSTPPAARYEVYAWWVEKRNQSESVDYTIRHGVGETTIVTMNQQSGGGQWQLLGEYYMGDGQDYVEVSSANDKFVADAIRWVEVKEPEITTIETTNYIHFDHLGTPRQVTDQSQTVIWRWDSTPFGDSLPDEDPDGDLQTYVLNLRFPGQYYDEESGLHYNYFRNYDPSTGRYIESDPIGLEGGLNTYAYVNGSPLLNSDSSGLRASYCKRPLGDYSGKRGSGPPFLNHQFICVTLPNGNVRCDSNNNPDSDTNPLSPTQGVPSLPSRDNEAIADCKNIDDDKDRCFENCVLAEWAKPRPNYAIGPLGTDCQEYSRKIVQKCRAQCN